MKEQRPLVTHYCEACGIEFSVPQGSRQRYCPTCLIERVTEGMNRLGKRKEK